MNARLRGTVIVLIRTLACFGNRSGNRQAPGTGPHKEGDPCPGCPNGFLKTDPNGVLLCSSCGWDERDDD
jgi:hypothetical protein